MQLDIHLDINPTTLVIVMVSLFLFGMAYNHLVAWLEKQGHDEGYTAILVVVGVLVTVVACTPLIGIESSLILLLAFLASGSSMIAGSIYRYMQRRSALNDDIKRTIRQLATEGHSDGESTRLAK